jgi:hypothetical protein
MKRLGVLGTLVWDEIWPFGATEPRRQWGGIAYSLAAASAACPDGWSIHPIVRAGSDLADLAFSFLEKLPNTPSLSGVRVLPEPNNRVQLRYRSPAERFERLSGGVSGWSWAELEPHLVGLDALYVNFLSGYELDLPVAARLRAEASIPVYADLHSLFLGRPGRSARRPRRLPSWREWLGCFDAVQMNAGELSLLGPPREDPFSLLPALLDEGPLLALVTDGGAGARYASADPLGPPLHWRSGPRGAGNVGARVAGARVVGVEACPQGPLEGDPTGCGDVWGSVAFCSLLEGRGLHGAIRRAHRAAAIKLVTRRIDDLASSLTVLDGVP